MKKIITIGGSNSTTSINRNLAKYAGSMLEGCDSISLDLNDFVMPLYSPEIEAKDGVPDKAKMFVKHIESSDGVILSLAEHNGSYSVAFKNILDWSSRFKQKLWSDKPMLMMSTSPGGRGGATVLEAAKTTFPHLGAQIISTYSLPSFYENYNDASGIIDSDLKQSLVKAIGDFSKAL